MASPPSFGVVLDLREALRARLPTALEADFTTDLTERTEPLLALLAMEPFLE